MDLDAKKLKKLVKIMRTEGVLALKSGDIEISLSPAAIFPTKQPKHTKESAPEESDRIYTPEEVLTWSSAGIPDEALN